MKPSSLFSLFVAIPVLLALCGLTPHAVAAEPPFTSPRGFSITPPDGWKVLSKDGTREVTAVIKKEFPKFDIANLDRMAVMFMNPTDGGMTNLNVVVTQGRLPIGDSGAEQKLADMLRTEYTKLGVTMGKMTSARKNFGSHPAIMADFESNIGGQPTRQWQVAMLSGKQTIIVTCTSPQPTFEKHAPAFMNAIEGMTFPPDAGGDMPSWLKYGIIGGAVGGLIGALQKLFGVRKKDGAGA
jgi:hypothetical protein